MMKLGVPKETADGERRVALVPDVAKSLRAKVSEKVEPLVESGAGAAAGHSDASYEEAGASIADDAACWGAPVVLHVRPPSGEEISKLSRGQVLVSHLSPLTAAESNRALAEAGVTAFAMEAIPRTTRAQAMDALSSQANLAGYAATLLAAREQIASLGGRPLELDFIPDAEGEGGYARPLTDEENEKIRDALTETAAKQDVIITTAQIPGRDAPLLITEEAVRGMAPGSVIIDLAADSGGNAEPSRPGETVDVDGVKVIGPDNLVSDMAADASQLYAKNLENLLGLLVGEEGELKIDFEDDIVDAACIAHEGQIRGERTAK